MFDELEFDPMAAGMGLLTGIIALFVMSKVEVGLIFKLGSFALSCIAGYFVFSTIKSRA